VLKEEIQKRDVEVYDTAYASGVASRVNSDTKCGVCRSFTTSRLVPRHPGPSVQGAKGPGTRQYLTCTYGDDATSTRVISLVSSAIETKLWNSCADSCTQGPHRQEPLASSCCLPTSFLGPNIFAAPTFMSDDLQNYDARDDEVARLYNQRMPV
jgi:hypothetical protein